MNWKITYKHNETGEVKNFFVDRLSFGEAAHAAFILRFKLDSAYSWNCTGVVGEDGTEEITTVEEEKVV